MMTDSVPVALGWATVRAIAGGALWVALGGTAAPRDLKITDQQQQSIYVICEKAARSPANSLDELVDIGIFCRNWRDLVSRNNSVVPTPKPDQEPEK